MANDDVIEMAERLLAKCDGYELPPYTDSLIVEDLVKELRASRARVAELEQDARRLDWYILHNCPEAAGSHEQTTNALRIEREIIDAAMAGEGE